MSKLKLVLFVLVAASSLLYARAATPFADELVAYHPGAAYAPGFVHPVSALGELSQTNPFGDPVDPFNPPFGTNQIVSIGAGGWLEVRWHTPILNHPHNPYGRDFTIFGNSGFIITNDFDLERFEWIGTPATDGSLFGFNPGVTRVLVSRDGRTYFELDLTLASITDGFPTDPAGDPCVPIDPALVPDDFAGATLAGIRSLYGGSAGGASFDISWAMDASHQPVFLPEINYVRVEVLTGRSEIDGLAKVARSSAAKGRMD